jgi:hypothetical protein
MVVVHHEPIKALTNFATLLQPAGPFVVMEYVSKHSKRKDYEVSYEKYEKELKVPYYLAFYPDADELTLFQLRDGKYHAVHPNAAGRLAIPELELEVALLDGWMRYWFRGELLPLPGDLLRRLNATESKLTATQVKLTATEQQLTAKAGELTAAQEKLNAEAAAKAEAERQAETERAARLAAEAELARLCEELAKAKKP